MMSPPLQFNVFALGSPHGDDRVGWEVAEVLLADSPENGAIEILRTPWDLLHHLRADRPTVILDACHSQRPPGEVFRIPFSELACLSGCSSHSAPLCDILALADLQGRLPAHLVIIGIEVEQAGPGYELSSAVRAAIPLACDQIRTLVTIWAEHGHA